MDRVELSGALNEQQARRAAATATPQALAAWLQEHLGQQLVAYVAGLMDPGTVGRWAAGKTTPRLPRLARMRLTYVAAKVLENELGRSTGTWFTGSNDLLDGRSPTSRIRSAGPTDTDVVTAAHVFVDGTY